MRNSYKPENYNSVSPYFVVNGAQRFIDLLKSIFGAEELRRYDNTDRSIMHAEVRIDDSVIMVGDASAQYPANSLLTHIYVPDVDVVFRNAMEAGCESLDTPSKKEGDPDKRGSFKDFSGNTWSIATQVSPQ